MIIKIAIANTAHFKTLNNIQQKMLMNKTNIEIIRHGYKMSILTSYENWIQKVSPSHNIKTIVFEILS
jgi:hypothetical protein